jgi:chromosome segregation ATPase
MPTALIICAAAVFVLCAWYFERRHRALEARMTIQVKERYAAYIELEERVRVALTEFDRLESTFEAEVRKSREQIKSLEEVLNSLEGVENAPMETPGGFLGVLDEGDANVQAQPITLTGERRDFEAELQHWERKVEGARNEARNEIERQRQQITDLTTRLRQLEPSATAWRQHPSYVKSESGTGTSAEGLAVAPSDLEQRIQKAEISARELVTGLEGFLRSSADGITNLSETLASCKPLLEQQVRDRARTEELELQAALLVEQREQLESQRTELEKSCASLEERCGSLDGSLRQREQEVERAKAAASELEQQSQENARRLATTVEELSSLRHDLTSERERSEREALAREELARNREELTRSVAQLKSKLDEESTRSASLGGELDGARARLDQYVKQCKELEAKTGEQGNVLSAQADMLQAREEEIGRLRNRVGALEGKLTSTRDTIGGQKGRLGELMEAIQVAQQEQNRHKELLSEQSAHIQEAHDLLEALRPVMETLEGELEKKQTA